MNIDQFPEITTDRLILKETVVADCNEVLFLRSDIDVNKYIKRPKNRQTKTIEDARKFIQKIKTGFENKEFISWKITLKSNPKMIGTICLWNFSEDFKNAEIGYDLNPVFQKQGIMSEAMNAVLKFGFNTLNLNQVEAFTHVENESSKKLLENNGFTRNNNRKDEGNLMNCIFEIHNPNNGLL